MANGDSILDVAPDALLAAWDFSANPGHTEIIDLSGHGVDLRTINGPCRAVTGFNWSGEDIDHRSRPTEYGAIHFHDDDLDDARWGSGLLLDRPPGHT